MVWCIFYSYQQLKKLNKNPIIVCLKWFSIQTFSNALYYDIVVGGLIVVVSLCCGKDMTKLHLLINFVPPFEKEIYIKRRTVSREGCFLIETKRVCIVTGMV